MASSLFTTTLQAEYQRLFDTCVIRPEKYPEVNAVVDKIIHNRSRYQAVGNKVNVPWFFIGIVHCMEGSLSFTVHLHNGDPLAARTIQVPKGRPIAGKPPFSWEESAEDALIYDKANLWKDWTVPGMLFRLEGYNGYGYRKLNPPKHSPYLWSCSNHYTKGKYVADGKFSATAVSKQTGAAVLLRRMAERQVVSFGIAGRLMLIKQLGQEVLFSPNRYAAKAAELQKLLNLSGAHLMADGKAGRNTSDAYFNLSRSYLKGDPKGNGIMVGQQVAHA
jgi:lysozyme family protein